MKWGIRIALAAPLLLWLAWAVVSPRAGNHGRTTGADRETPSQSEETPEDVPNNDSQVGGGTTADPEPEAERVQDSLDGRVVDPNGTPVPNAAVYVIYRGDSWPRFCGDNPPTPTTRTDAMGRFQVTALKEETLWVMGSDEGHCPSDYSRIEPDDRARGVTVALRRGGTIEGSIESVVGEIEGREIQLYSHNGGLGWRDVLTDRWGRFRFDQVIPQKYILELKGDWGGMEYRIPIDVREGETITHRIGARGKPIQVNGKLSRAGQPWGGVHLQVKRIGSGTGWGGFVTGVNGGFTVDLPEAGVYRIQIGSDRGSTTSIYRRVPDLDVVQMHLNLGSCSIHGTIPFEKHQKNYRPVSLVRVTKNDPPRDPCSDYWETAAVSGRFSFVGLPPGQYTLRAPRSTLAFDGQLDRFHPTLHDDIQLTEDDHASVEVRLAPVGTVAGMVDGVTGLKMSSARIRLHPRDRSDEGNPRETTVGADRRFEFRDLPPGKYVVEFLHPKNTAASRSVTVTALGRSWVRLQLR